MLFWVVRVEMSSWTRLREYSIQPICICPTRWCRCNHPRHVSKTELNADATDDKWQAAATSPKAEISVSHLEEILFFSSRTSKFAIVWPSLPATRPEMGSWTPPKHPNITTSPFLTSSIITQSHTIIKIIRSSITLRSSTSIHWSGHDQRRYTFILRGTSRGAIRDGRTGTFIVVICIGAITRQRQQNIC